MIRWFVALSLVLAGTFAAADDERAHVNYMLHCQGCHLPQAEGFEGRVPPMKDFVGYFLHSTEGRDFLIRVPGVAHSALGDIEITELMNWLLQSFSADQLPATFAPFTVDEVASLRQDPELAPEAARIEILGDIAAALPPLADALAREE
ncbi:MAG: cytochrome c, class I [Woeseiaceae bacterium]